MHHIECTGVWILEWDVVDTMAGYFDPLTTNAQLVLSSVTEADALLEARELWTFERAEEWRRQNSHVLTEPRPRIKVAGPMIYIGDGVR